MGQSVRARTIGVRFRPAALSILAVAGISLSLAGWQPVAAESRSTISVASAETCAITGETTVVCWTYDVFSDPPASTPIAVTSDIAGTTPLSGARIIANGPGHRCAVLLDGTLGCWGQNAPTEAGAFGGFPSSGGQLGDGTTTDSEVPVLVIAETGGARSLTDVDGVAVGLFHTCALLGDTTVRCWGDNAEGQLGDGTTNSRAAPAPVIDEGSVPLSGVTNIAAGDFHTCALLTDTTVRCWGANRSGRLGDGTEDTRTTPTAVIAAAGESAPLSGVTAISLSGDGASGFNGIEGGAHTCAVVDARVMCWGNNSSGQVDTPTAFAAGPAPLLAPVEVTGLSGPAAAIASGGADTCALLADGTVECWGFNWDWGRVTACLGDPTCPVGDTPPGPRPVLASDGPLSGVQAISAGAQHACGILGDGSVRCWGGRDAGPVGVPALGAIAAVAAAPTQGPNPTLEPSPTLAPTAEPTASAPPAPGPTTSTGQVDPAEGGGSGGDGPTASVAFHRSVPTPAEINLELPNLVQSLVLTAALLVFIPFPSALFNSTLEENYAEVVSWFRRPRRWLQRSAQVFQGVGPRWRAAPSDAPGSRPSDVGADVSPRRHFAASYVGVGLFLLLTALLAGFLDPGFGLDARSLATFAGLAIGLVVTLVAFNIPRALALLETDVPFVVRALPGTFLIGAVCVLVSRLTSFQPGYLYGLVIGLGAASQLGPTLEGRTAARSTVVMLAVAFAAWIGLSVVAPAATTSDENLAVLALRSALATVLVAGLEGALFGLLPVRFFPGGVIREWDLRAWVALSGVAILGYFLILINPSSGYLADSSRTPFLMIVGLLAFFGLGSVAFWGYFRYRPTRAR